MMLSGSISETDAAAVGPALFPRTYAAAEASIPAVPISATSGLISPTLPALTVSQLSMEANVGNVGSLPPAAPNQQSLLLEQTLEDVEEVKEEVGLNMECCCCCLVYKLHTWRDGVESFW